MRLMLVLWLLHVAVVAAAEPTSFMIEKTPDSVIVRADEARILTYRYSDLQGASHPYFAPVSTISGRQVSRNHPPVEGLDKTDHPGLHTGLWLSFGDLNGHDFWRGKAQTRHLRFDREPSAVDQRASWSVINQYLATGTGKVICEETAQYTVRMNPLGYELEMASEFRPLAEPLVFGDQEEMGLGVRVHTPLAVASRNSGRILDADGRRNEKEVWGKTSTWSDYAGPLENRWVGIQVISDPRNFRPSWCHARDYGLMVLNPFGRQAFTGGEPSQYRVEPGQSLKLGYRIIVHESDKDPFLP